MVLENIVWILEYKKFLKYIFNVNFKVSRSSEKKSLIIFLFRFVSYIRLNKSAFQYVLDMIGSILQESKIISAVPKTTKTAATKLIL